MTIETPVTNRKYQNYGPKAPLFLDVLNSNGNQLEALRESFETVGYALIRGFLQDPLLSVVHRYMVMMSETGHGRERDGVVQNSVGMYGDPLMESILDLMAPAIGAVSQRELMPTFAYWRLYKTGDSLHRHIDRISCEISATLMVGANLEAIHQTKPDYAWAIYTDDVAHTLQPGDVVFYKGCEVEHWREPFEGTHQAQAFLHFVDRNGPFKLCRFDGRPQLGLPPSSRSKPVTDILKRLNQNFAREKMKTIDANQHINDDTTHS